MICLKGDTVRLKTGETAEVLETWGRARYWYKLKTGDGKIVYAMNENIESIIRRYRDQSRTRRKK